MPTKGLLARRLDNLLRAVPTLLHFAAKGAVPTFPAMRDLKASRSWQAAVCLDSIAACYVHL